MGSLGGPPVGPLGALLPDALGGAPVGSSGGSSFAAAAAAKLQQQPSQPSHCSITPPLTAAEFSTSAVHPSSSENCAAAEAGAAAVAATAAAATAAAPANVAGVVPHLPWDAARASAAAEPLKQQLQQQQQQQNGWKLPAAAAAPHPEAPSSVEGPPERLCSGSSEVLLRLQSGLQVGDLSVLGFTGGPPSPWPEATAANGAPGDPPSLSLAPVSSSKPPYTGLRNTAATAAAATAAAAASASTASKRTTARSRGMLGAQQTENAAAAAVSAAAAAVAPAAAAVAPAAAAAPPARGWGTPRLQLQRRQQLAPLRPPRGLLYNS